MSLEGEGSSPFEWCFGGVVDVQSGRFAMIMEFVAMNDSGHQVEKVGGDELLNLEGCVMKFRLFHHRDQPSDTQPRHSSHSLQSSLWELLELLTSI